MQSGGGSGSPLRRSFGEFKHSDMAHPVGPAGADSFY